VATGKARKAPGCDVISHEFFKITWEVTKQDLLNIMNTMYSDAMITDTQKRGVILCIPKTSHLLTPNEYRPLTLLNTDYKLLARLISNRMRPWLPHILTASQYCGRQGNTIFDAFATVRDAVAHATVTRPPLYVVTIDSQEAFDKISHTYLIAVLQEHGFSEQF
jgi:hypothetical protein